MELIVVIILLGVMTGIAIPRYSATLEKSHVQDAIMQLTTIHAAEQIMYARTGKYWPPDLGAGGLGYNLAAINTNLNLNIIANGLTYTCFGQGSWFTCIAVRDAPATQFDVEVTEDPISSANPACLAFCP